MATSRPILEYNQQMKEALLEYDFEYFLKLDIEANDYHQTKIETMQNSYIATRDRLKREHKKNKKQHFLLLDSDVRAMVVGGMLPMLFQIDGWAKSNQIINFPAYGEARAQFELWQKVYRRKQRKKKAWDYIVKGGALLAYILSVIKFGEYILKAL